MCCKRVTEGVSAGRSFVFSVLLKTNGFRGGVKSMTYVVTERCVDSRYTECVADCPVDCFYEITDPRMLIINPDECIDCDACVALCPVNAIYPEAEVPDEYQDWVEANDADVCDDDNRVSDTDDPLDGALTIEEVREKEEEKFGFAIDDPSSAAH